MHITLNSIGRPVLQGQFIHQHIALFDLLKRQLTASSGHIHEVKCAKNALVAWLFGFLSSSASVFCTDDEAVTAARGWFKLGCTCQY